MRKQGRLSENGKSGEIRKVKTIDKIISDKEDMAVFDAYYGQNDLH